MRRRPWLSRRQHSTVSRALEQSLFDLADVLSEGSMQRGPGARATYFGSTMISIAFARLATAHASSLPRALQKELVHAVEGSVRVRLRAMRLARAEAVRRVYNGVLGTAVCELRVRDDGKQLHIDVDLEAEVRLSSRAKRS
jgi:hypothetical protein